MIAEVPGSDLAHEVVLIGAHHDSWDLGEGAAEDGAGVAIVSAAAGLIADRVRETGRAPRRTIRVVLFANEENGFDGALAYGRQHGRMRHQLVGESDFGCGAVLALPQNVACWAVVAWLAAQAPMPFMPA